MIWYWVADWNLSRAQAVARLGGHAVDMVDVTHSTLARCLETSAEFFAGYLTGSPDIQWTSGDQESVLHRTPPTQLVWIDQSDDISVRIADIRMIEDVESGAETVTNAVLIAAKRAVAKLDTTIYISAGALAGLEDVVAAARLPPGRIGGYQYASPTSNPATPLPGTGIILKIANADLSVMLPEWAAAHIPPTPPPGLNSRWDEAKIGFERATGKWRITGLPGEAA